MNNPDKGSNYTDVLQRLSPEALEKLDVDGGSNYEFNSAVFSFALSWLNAGGDEAGYLETVTGAYVGETYPRNDLERRLSKTFADAEAKYTGYHPATADGKAYVVEQLNKALVAIDGDDDLPPRVKPTARALVTRAINVGVFSLNVSTRQLAEDTGLQPPTISRHLRIIKRSMLITRTEGGSLGNSRTFHINLEYGNVDDPDNQETTNVKNSYILSTCKNIMCNIFLHFELWSKHCLGSKAQQLYGDLTMFPCSASEIDSNSELSRPTVNKHLATLIEHNLVVEIPTGKRKRYAVNLLPDVESVLESTEARLSQQQQHQRHTEQRSQLDQARNRVVDTYRRAGVFPVDPYSPLGYPRQPFKLTTEGLAHLEHNRPNWSASDVPLEYRVYPPKHDPYDGGISAEAIAKFYAGTDVGLWDTEYFEQERWVEFLEMCEEIEQRHRSGKPRVIAPDPFENAPTKD